MDRSFPQYRDYMFWNIVITHMLSTSSQIASEKRKLYGTLAQKQIERAAQLSEQAKEAGSDLPARGIKTEQEILLLYQIIDTHGTEDDYQKLIKSPLFNPVAQFHMGRTELLTVVANRYRSQGKWDDLFEVCESCLSSVDEKKQISMLASDWAIWKLYLEAASHIKATKDIEGKVRQLLLNVIKSDNVKPIYRRNILLARVLAAFVLDSADASDVVDSEPSSVRFKELLAYVDDQAESPACFDDVKLWVEALDVDAIQYLANEHLTKSGAGSSRKQLLALKFQHLLASGPYAASEKSPNRRSILTSSIDLYKSITSSNKDLSSSDQEITAELSILMVFCLVDLALPEPQYEITQRTSDSSQLLLQALIILDRQLIVTPKHSQVSLIAFQLHMLFGSSYEAIQIWEPLAVKRTILDSLGPLFYDRVSTVSPSFASSEDHIGWDMISSIRGHYETSLKLRMPRRLIDAFQGGNYCSVMGVARYIDNLRYGCTRTISLVEEARGERFFGRTYGEIFDDPRYTEITDAMDLAVATDFGSFPSLFFSGTNPIHKRLALGPHVTSTRMHLARLSEAFHDALGYRPPTLYKAAAGSSHEETYILETVTGLANSLARFLPDTAEKCTVAEQEHYDLLSVLCSVLTLSVSKSEAFLAVFPQLAEAVKATLEGQSERVTLAANATPVDGAIWRLRSLHEVGMLRDSTAAVRETTTWLINYNNRMKEKDRSGQSNLPKEVLAGLNSMRETADKIAKKGSRWAPDLKQSLSVLRPDLKAFIGGGEYGKDVCELVGNDRGLERLISSWNKNISKWQGVVWE
ncbi:hypothetical protein VHEMI09310 [[Torrubiella] hemipterigena]|nr:hypothetical protein VHEMI09310 [[Torrubiella] hemipterigena]